MFARNLLTINLASFAQARNRGTQQVNLSISGKMKDVEELLIGSSTLSRQGRTIIAFLNNGERLPLPFANDVRMLFSRVNEEKNL